ncbi:FlgN protein [compost metagenome]|uniref:Flagella synthesis protein FlgN n=1 Tax=Pseudomonas jinjuensis TaxID=198616 RepID=A0A1H0I4K3_9PSED|nr:flagellar export chaperone FlgN [Pseudomonas jinjuensis]SDO26374.1 flagella synthesis protein FlgN [Pseudomonas jinjuensis]
MSDSILLQLFIDDIDAANRLLQSLDEEFQALEQRDLPRLQQLLDGKLPLVQQLERNARLRGDILQQGGLSLDRAGLARLVAQGAASELLERSDELAARLEQCQQANLRNGRVIRAGQVSTGRLLDILRGQDTPSLYDRHGGATSGTRQRPLSQA